MYCEKAKADPKAQLVSIKVRSEREHNSEQVTKVTVLTKESCQRAGAAGLVLKAEYLTAIPSPCQPLSIPACARTLLKAAAADTKEEWGQFPLGFLEETASEQRARWLLQDHFRLLPHPPSTHFQPEEMQLKEMSQTTQQAVHYHRLVFSFGRRALQHNPEPTHFLKASGK